MFFFWLVGFVEFGYEYFVGFYLCDFGIVDLFYVVVV